MGLIPAHAGKIPTRRPSSRCSWAHPRSRGENQCPGDRDGAEGGSSPLTRGKLCDRTAQFRRPGLIPAHAGKINCGVGAGNHAWAHPRSRGENVGTLTAHAINAGSSPLTRGKCPKRGDSCPYPGLIPAHAGKIRHEWTLGSAQTAHPRSRGENIVVFGDLPKAEGSSPLTRGKSPRPGRAECP